MKHDEILERNIETINKYPDNSQFFIYLKKYNEKLNFSDFKKYCKNLVKFINKKDDIYELEVEGREKALELVKLQGNTYGNHELNFDLSPFITDDED